MTHPAIDLAHKALRHLLAALLAATIAAPAAAFTPDEDAWIETINAFRAETADTGIASSIMVVKDPADGSSPLASAWMGGRCVFVIAVAGNSYSERLQGYARTPAVARLVVAAHEFGHCLHHASLQRGEKSLPPPKSPQAEAMADAFAVLWIYCAHPDKYHDALKFLRAIRAAETSALYDASLASINDAAARAHSGHSCSRQTVGAV